MPDEVDRVAVSNMWGMDSSRDPDANEDYGTGVLAVNCGRKLRQPLQARVGLQPCTSSTGNTELGGRVFALGALVQGGRLSLIVRTDGGVLIAVKDVDLEV